MHVELDNAVSPIHLRSLEQNLRARPKLLVHSMGLESIAMANETTFFFLLFANPILLPLS